MSKPGIDDRDASLWVHNLFAAEGTTVKQLHAQRSEDVGGDTNARRRDIVFGRDLPVNDQPYCISTVVARNAGRRRGRADTRKGIESVDGPREESAPRSHIVVGVTGQIGARGQERPLVETQVRALPREKAANHQVRSHEQRETEGHLDDSQRRLRALTRATERAEAAALFECVNDPPGGRSDRRQQSDRQRRKHRNCNHEGDDPDVDPNLEPVRKLLGHRHPHPVEHPDRTQRTESGADTSEDCAFAQDGPEQSRPAGTKRGSHGHLPLPGGAVHQQQVGQVRANDEQHKRHGGHQHRRKDFRLAADVRISKRHDPKRKPTVRFGVRCFESRRDAVEIALCALQGHAETQDRHRARVASGSRRFVPPKRHVQLRTMRELEARRHHSNDGARAFVDQHGTPDDSGVATVAALPQPMREDDAGLEPRRSAFFRREAAPEHRLNAERSKETGRH